MTQAISAPSIKIWSPLLSSTPPITTGCESSKTLSFLPEVAYLTCAKKEWYFSEKISCKFPISNRLTSPAHFNTSMPPSRTPAIPVQSLPLCCKDSVKLYASCKL